MPITRRSFLIATTLPAASSVSSCRRGGPPEEELAALLGLAAEERSWIAGMTPDDQAHLLATLWAGTAESDRRSRGLLFALVEPRDRLFAYVGYPSVSRRRSVCDGLLRE